LEPTQKQKQKQAKRVTKKRKKERKKERRRRSKNNGWKCFETRTTALILPSLKPPKRPGEAV
jgi:hypothetical protein